MNRKSRNVKKSICFAALLFVSLYLMQGVCYAADNRTISQIVSQSDCEQGESFTLSVYLGGSEDSISISRIEGELEYDTALFTIIGVSTTSMMLPDSDFDEGVFTLTADTAKTLKKGDLLFQVQMEVQEDSSIGKTTICVKRVELEGEDGNISIVNMVPSSINILQSEDLDDEKRAEEDEPKADEDMDSSGYGSSDNKKESNKTSVTQTSGSGSKNGGGNTSGNQSTANKGTKSLIVKQLDKNYKTDAGFGNGWYFVIAFGFGVVAFVNYVVYRRISGKYIKE